MSDRLPTLPIVGRVHRDRTAPARTARVDRVTPLRHCDTCSCPTMVAITYLTTEDGSPDDLLSVVTIDEFGERFDAIPERRAGR